MTDNLRWRFQNLVTFAFLLSHSFPSCIHVLHKYVSLSLRIQTRSATHTHTRIWKEKVQLFEVPLRISGKKMGEKKEKHDCIFISSVERKGRRVKREGDGRYDMEASVFQTLTCDWDYPHAKYTNVFDRITMYLTNAICCSDTSLFLFLLNTLPWNWKWSDYVETFFPLVE